jgi:CMP-N-acetylneuraminic acid synthetase
MKRKYLELKKEDYSKVLRRGICRVVFEKVNNELREMYCTLDTTIIPKTTKEITEEALDTPKRRSNDNVVAVYDVQNEAWRSFRVNTVILFNSIKPSNPT